MGKKDNAAFALAENFHAVTALIKQLETFVKIHKEIAAGYQKYRKNGGEAISGVEKYVGIKKEEVAVAKKAKGLEAPVKEANAAKKKVESKKGKNKVKA
ncbi:MAG TPA: hypothetical protein HPP97_12665 [Desulfuromonadales bacterium]|nr:hypothetical protein [Desulfuromonadales bacterium]